MTDIEIVKLALEEKRNFRHIVEKFEKPLLRYIKRLMYLSINESEDILQDSFVKIYRNLNQYDGSFKLSSWIYRIVHNVAISHLRKNRKHFGISLTSDELEKIGEFEKSILLDKYSQEEVNVAVNNLEDKYKEIIVLRFFEEKSYLEISDILKLPVGTVGSLVSRGVNKLKQILK